MGILENRDKTGHRFPFLDFIRGLAVILMVIFHFSYDLDYFQFVDIDFQNDPFWWGFPRLIVFLFLICVGVSLRLTHGENFYAQKFVIRLLKLSGPALILSISTYLFFKERWIYFGILHCIFACSLLGIPFVKYPKVSLGGGVGILVLYFLLNQPDIFKKSLIALFPFLPQTSMDLIPLFPWFGVVLVGIFLETLPLFYVNFPKSEKMVKFFRFLGKNSLVIYLLHQPIFFGLLFSLKFLIFNV